MAKNATEGMASPAAILPWTVLLLGGHVLPAALRAAWVGWVEALPGFAAAALVTAVGATYAARAAGVLRFGHPLLGALLHPLGVLLLVAVQWSALLRRFAGRPAAWKGRSYAAAGAE